MASGSEMQCIDGDTNVRWVVGRKCVGEDEGINALCAYVMHGALRHAHRRASVAAGAKQQCDWVSGSKVGPLTLPTSKALLYSSTVMGDNKGV